VTDTDSSNRSQHETSRIPGLADGEKGAVIQRDHTTYAIAPHLPCGLVTPETLRRLADVAERYGCQALKVTSAGRIALIGLQAKDIDAAWSELGLAPGGLTGECVRSVRVCTGMAYCKRAQQDSVAIGFDLDRAYHGNPMPSKLKIGISGCGNQCAETATKDIGLVGMKQGWDLLVGGSGGAVTRLGTRIAHGCTVEQAKALVDGVLAFYRKNARPKERLCRTLARVGLDSLTESLGLPRVQST
jgi:NAD(P)H-nitrite reductase large subunit